MTTPPEPQKHDDVEDEVISTDGTVIAQAFRWSLLALVVLGGGIFGVGVYSGNLGKFRRS